MEEKSNETLLSDKVAILAELWMEYRYDEDFLDFFEYNDLGLPLAYALNEKIVEMTDAAKAFIEETFFLLLESLEVEDDGFEVLDELLANSYDS